MRISLSLVTLLLLMVPFGHAITSSGEHRIDALTDDSDINLQSIARSSTFTVSPANGWTTGGEEITITGSGFSDLAFSNTTDDGINHQWAETTMDYSDQAGRWNAVAVDSNGHIHVVQIKDESYQIRHSVNDGTGWISGKINDCGSTYCWDIHMVIDDNDHIHLAYTTYTSWDETLVYMNYDGTTWTDYTVSNSAHFGPIGIAVDSNNHPHISYALDGSDQCGVGLRISSYDGSSWSYTNVDQGANRGCESAIVIDESDHKYIAYQDRSSSKLKIATDKSGSWDSYLVDTGTTPSNLYPGYMTSMAVDQQGQFHIAHQDNKEYDLRYSTGAPNSQWTTTIVDATGHTGRDPSIAVDAADQPHIVYHTWSGQNLKYATTDPVTGNWTVSTLANSGDVGEGNSIFIDESGVMHVSFNDDTSDVLKYATKSTGLLRTMEITVQFGQYGSVTGTVVDDTTITVTTPVAGQTASTVDITLLDKNDDSHILSSAFTFISPDDVDMDGVLNVNDGCPNVAGNSTNDVSGCPDADGDGYSDAGDAYPNDATDWMDSDGDGVGDNADAFPNDANETLDTDGDGVGDNSDAFPSDPSETLDSDADGVGDNADAFPFSALETTDSDGDGVGDNSDMYPYDANETLDSDGDGVGDNADAFPNDANETVDSDGDGLGDNSDPNPFQHDFTDADGDTFPDLIDAFPEDGSQWLDSDGDGFGDNPDGNDSDSFINTPSQWNDSDGDGYGDNWGDSAWNETRIPEWTGIFIDGAVMSDYCPDESGNSTADGFNGCLDADGNGIADVFEQVENSTETNDSIIDTDNDGVSDLEDACPETSAGAQVNTIGCVVVDSSEDDSTSAFESFFSGDGDPVVTTVGIGAILLALFSLLQTNAVAAVLPDTFRWVQVLRKNSKLTKEELNELTYLQSLVQAYFSEPAELNEELQDMKSDLTGRFTNNELKKDTREKLFILIDELLHTSPDELKRIAHNDAYFGLAGTIDSKERTELLEQKVAMRDAPTALVTEFTPNPHTPSSELKGAVSAEDGYEYLEHPTGSGVWFIRNQSSGQWDEWKQ